MKRCLTCKWYDSARWHVCECPKMFYGYRKTKGDDEPDAVKIEDDEGWGMIVGPEFGCVHHQSKWMDAGLVQAKQVHEDIVHERPCGNPACTECYGDEPRISERS